MIPPRLEGMLLTFLMNAAWMAAVAAPLGWCCCLKLPLPPR